MTPTETLIDSYQGDTNIEAEEPVQGEKPDNGDMICGDCDCN